ncbi:MAG: 4Fe-4S binding protein [Candidatus Pacebacteria bacterium]|nr:4Fe-4S binding protein [Candidatus Paceibacterota bacterium]MDD3919356.1 4Fe-4S binding protein [Candidatus Paceibacterota bacterium]
MFQIDKDKCLGCGGCTITCPKGIAIGSENKAEIINEEELIHAGGESVCPYGAIVLEEDDDIEDVFGVDEEIKDDDDQSMSF